jgi:hypothetical protein
MWAGWMNLGFMTKPEMRESLRLLVQVGELMDEWWSSQDQYRDEIRA